MTNPTREDDEFCKKSAFQYALRKYLHQDWLMWSRLMLLVPIQLAALSVGVAHNSTWKAILALFAGMAAILWIYTLFNRDNDLRLEARHLMDKYKDVAVELELIGGKTTNTQPNLNALIIGYLLPALNLSVALVRSISWFTG